MDYTIKITYTKVDSLGQTVTKSSYFTSPASSKQDAITFAQPNIDSFIASVSGSLISVE